MRQTETNAFLDELSKIASWGYVPRMAIGAGAGGALGAGAGALGSEAGGGHLGRNLAVGGTIGALTGAGAGALTKLLPKVFAPAAKMTEQAPIIGGKMPERAQQAMAHHLEKLKSNVRNEANYVRELKSGLSNLPPESKKFRLETIGLARRGLVRSAEELRKGVGVRPGVLPSYQALKASKASTLPSYIPKSSDEAAQQIKDILAGRV